MGGTNKTKKNSAPPAKLWPSGMRALILRTERNFSLSCDFLGGTN